MSILSYSKLVFSTKYIPLWIIVAIAAFLRFYNLEGTSLSNDELSAISRLHFTNLDDLIWKGVAIDGHPAGVQFFLYFFTRIVGISDFLIRAPFAWWGVFTVLACFAWCKLWFGKWTAYFTAASVAFLQFSVFYSQLARPYSPGLLFSMLILYHFGRLVVNKNHDRIKLYWLRYIGFSILCCYVHYFSLLFAVLVAISGFFVLPKSEKRHHIIACCIITLLCLPHIPIYWVQLQLGGLAWLGKPGFDFLPEYIFYIFNESWLVLGTALLLFFVSCTYGFRQKCFNRFHVLALLLFILPFIIGFLKSYFGKPVLQNSVLIFCFPLLPALLFSNIHRIKISSAGKYFLLACWSLICIGSLVIEKQYYQKEHYAQFKPLAEKITNWNSKYGHDNIAVAMNVNNKKYIQYYLKNPEDTFNIFIYRLDNHIFLDSLLQIVQRSNTPYFVYGWSNIANLPETEKIIRLKYNDQIESDPHVNSGIKLFKSSENEIHPRLILHDSANKNLIQIPYMAVIENALIRVEADISLSKTDPEIDIVASIENAENKITYWSTVRVINYFEDGRKNSKVVWFTSLPGKITENETLKIYIWNRSEAKMQVRNFAVRFY